MDLSANALSPISLKTSFLLSKEKFKEVSGIKFMDKQKYLEWKKNVKIIIIIFCNREKIKWFG